MADKITWTCKRDGNVKCVQRVVGKRYKLEYVYWCDMALLTVIGLKYWKINVTENKLILLCPDE